MLNIQIRKGMQVRELPVFEYYKWHLFETKRVGTGYNNLSYTDIPTEIQE